MNDQLEQWLLGNSIHNKDRDECCPDFSCCNALINTSLEVRQRFAKAHKGNDENTKNEMLGMFLQQAMQTLNTDVYVAGLSTEGHDQ